MTYFQAIILAIIEGLTEFLPVSSTGHMILASSFMGIQSDEFVKMFTVAIQFGTILSVVVLYFKRFFQSVGFYFKLFVAFIPAAIAGLLLGDYIDKALENPIGVAVALLLGGIVLLFVDKWFKNATVEDSSEITYPTAFKIGLAQCIALFPGVSRSAATIIGGMSQKLTRKAAAEFSFFLAVPTMFAATGKKLLDYFMITKAMPSSHEISLLVVGNVVGFVVALIAIKSFISFLSKYGFKMFGIYRIVVGAVILILYFSGVNMFVV